MQKILIIGSQGVLGQELVKIFKKDKSYKVIAWDKNDIDITREKEVVKKIGFTKPEIIINAFEYSAVDECEKNKKELEMAQKINAVAPGYLASAAKKNKAVLIHYSTDHVFDGEPKIPEPAGCNHSCESCSLHEGFVPEIGFAEDAKAKPINKFGKTKLAGEKEIQKNTKKFYIIRTSRLFGKNKSKTEKRNFFDIMIEVSKNNKEVNAVDDETACFTYVPDLVKKTKEIIESKKEFGIYHIINSEPVTWYDACRELYRTIKIKTKITAVTGDEFPRLAKRPFYSVLVNTKLNPMRSWKVALKDYLKEVNK